MPQFSVHRGEFQVLLYQTALERLGAGAIRLGHTFAGFAQDAGGVTATFRRENA